MTVKSLIDHMKEINPAGFQEYINYIPKNSQTALDRAIYGKDRDKILLVISAGAKLDTIGKGEQTPLTLATERELTDVVNILINKMRETNPQGLQQYLNHMNIDNKTALMIAQEKGYTDIVAILQQAGATH